MRALRISVVTACVTTLALSSAVAAAPAGISGPLLAAPPARAVRLHPPPPPIAPVVSQMLDRVNAERAAWGLAPMSYDERLGLAAQRHSDDQARRGVMSHAGADGSTVAIRVDRVGYSWSSLAENVAYDYGDVDAVMQAWMTSDGHRRNILSSNVHLGVGLAYSSDGHPYWTQVFGTPG